MADPGKAMHEYYSIRAPVYDRVYHKPERQTDIRRLEAEIPALLRDKEVIEIACGTGYWTQFIAPAAKRLTATDITAEAMELARGRPNVGAVDFQLQSAFALPNTLGMFNAAFAGLWISHIAREDLRDFLVGLHCRLHAGSRVVFVDNSTRQCVELPITETDAQGNTYQTRTLDDGTEHKILKNFPSAVDLRKSIHGLGINPRFEKLEHFWLFTYETV